MTVETGRTRFHYGFYAAMKVEYDIMRADVTYEQEIQLGEDPIRLDFLILKKEASVILTDPIGVFFKAVNLFEYKSPEDGLSMNEVIRDIFKKDFDAVEQKANERVAADMLRDNYPLSAIEKISRN